MGLLQLQQAADAHNAVRSCPGCSHAAGPPPCTTPRLPPSLQEILADAVTALAGDKNIISNGVQIVDYEQGTDPATGRRQVTAVA